MTTAAAPTTVDIRARPVERDAVLALARTEAKRALRGVPFWLGVVFTVYLSYEGRSVDWQSGNYTQFFLNFAPLAIGIFTAGVLAGGRDRHRNSDAGIADDAALDGSARAAARLLALVPLVAIGAIGVVAVAIGIRIEGGMWMGDSPGRTDTAAHGLAEVLAPILLLAVAGAVGVALGRTFRRRAPVIVVGFVVLFMLTGAYWMWQWAPAIYLNPAHVQPLELTIDADATNPDTLPAHWLLVDPDERGGEWRRTLVHTPLAAWHDVYLVGVVLLAIAAAVRGPRGRALLTAGLLVVALGITAQVLVMPDNFVTIE